ncbi:hypothetical protein JCM10207_001728 [Rhodosporidiobolus poonsookiae]
MDLPSPPVAARVAAPPSSSAFDFSPPTSSPISSRPPSPSGQRISYAYPVTPSVGTSAAPSAAASRSGSLSKDPLLRRQRNRGGVAGWFRRFLADTGSQQESHELGERRGRRLSAAQVEAALDRNREREDARRAVKAQAASAAEKGPWWKLSKERQQLVVAFAMIALVGMNDSATGANLDSMQEHYKVSYDKISTVFLANTAGYFLSSISASFFLHHFGIQVSLATAAAGMSGGCIVLSVAPPFIVFVLSLALLGFGSGMYDACITTVIAHEEDGVLMSLLYSCFGIGATFSPLIIGGFVDRGYDWNRYYNIPLGISVLLAIAGYLVFRGYEIPPDEAHDAHLSTAQAPQESTAGQEGQVIHARAVMSAQERMKRALRIKACWVGFGLIMLAFASSDTLSAWIVSFLVQKRNSPAAASRYMLSGVWGGIAVGRVLLAFLLDKRLGERTFAITMLVAASGMLAILYVKNYVVDAVAMVLVGVFMGPVTPKVLSSIGARVPPSLKGSAMSLTIGLGLIGSSVGPLLFGVVAGRGGLSTLPAVLIGASLIACVLWAVLPTNRRRED